MSTPLQVSLEIPEEINITHAQSISDRDKSGGRIYRCQLALERGAREPYFSSLEANFHSEQEACRCSIPMGFSTPLSKLTPLRASEAADSSPDISLITSASATPGTLTGQENCIVLFSNLVTSNAIVPKIQVRSGSCVAGSVPFSSFLFEELYLGMPSQLPTAWTQSQEQPQKCLEKDQAEVEKFTKTIQKEGTGTRNGDENSVCNILPAVGFRERDEVYLHDKVGGDPSNATHEGFACKVDKGVDVLSTEGSETRTSGSNKSLILQTIPIAPQSFAKNESFHLLSSSSTLSLEGSKTTDMHHTSAFRDQPNTNQPEKRFLSIRAGDTQRLYGDERCIQRGCIKTSKQSTPDLKAMLALQHTESGVFDTHRFPEYFALASVASVLAIDSMLSSCTN
ncbi:unnamed protein product [Phytomonas sp. EM1]|nr:unnamed protein product [Phytomonas sp. EM1]|eukprot:CCW64155.1 unnamed protein product [Phytomonas sp. isolate EM1]